MFWQIYFASSCEKWLNNLNEEKFNCITYMVKILSLKGNNLKLPYSKPLGKGLFELRERRFGLRIYYTFLSSSKILFLKGGTKATQKNDIISAKRALKSQK